MIRERKPCCGRAPKDQSEPLAGESTAWHERADPVESTVVLGASRMDESTASNERAVYKEGTGNVERAAGGESTVNDERSRAEARAP